MTSKQKAYRKYLLTEHWKILRTQAVERDGGKCSECESQDRLNVHHKVYRGNWEDGLIGDLVTLCRDCHRTEHGLYVWTPFDRIFRTLDLKIRCSEKFSDLPQAKEVESLAPLISKEWDEREFEGLLRNLAGMRIILTSSKMWSSWLKKPGEITSRLWPWSKQKRLRLQGKEQCVG